MKRKITILYCVIICVFVVISYIGIQLFIYKYDQDANERSKNYCFKNIQFANDLVSHNQNSLKYNNAVYKEDSCYCKMFSLLLPRLLVYKVKINNEDMDFIRLTKEPVIVPDFLFEKTDVLITYGFMFDSVLFEKNFADLYKKKVYIYNCWNPKPDYEDFLLNYSRECLVSKNQKDIIPALKNKKTHTFEQKFKELELYDKKIFIKLNIYDSDLEFIPEILDYSDNIQGISITVNCKNSRSLINANKILKQIEKDFIPISRQSFVEECITDCNCKYAGKNFSNLLSLTYINKKFVSKKYLLFRQYYPDNKDIQSPFGYNGVLPPFEIDWRVVLYQKIKNILEKDE